MFKRISSTIFVVTLFLFSSANAATLTVQIQDLELFSDGVYGFELGFLVDGEWNFVQSSSSADTSTIDWNKGVNGFVMSGGTSSPYSEFIESPNPDVFPEYAQYTNTWDLNANLPNDTLKILANDEGYGSNVLKNGILFALIYPDTVTLKLSKIAFISATDLTTILDFTASGTVFGAGDNTLTFSAVPIPSSILLLAGGIFTFLGISRRKI